MSNAGGVPRLCVAGAGIVVVCVAVLAAGAAGEQSATETTALQPSLPPVGALPPGFDAVGTLASRGIFHAAGGRTSLRQHDGDAHHGSDSLPVWARSTKASPTQGVLYGVADGHVVSTGYLVQRQDLIDGYSFRHLSLRGLEFPPAQQMTIDFIEGEDGEHYLFLWHFAPPEDASAPTRPLGALPPVTSLPARFSLYACDQYPNAFCPRMGRHYRDVSMSLHRPPTASGDDGVTYGEAAGKLIFIEYVLPQKHFAAKASWSTMLLNGIPIPPVDNLHLLHYNGADGAPGRYTAHMYFVPEKTYLGWEEEPPAL